MKEYDNIDINRVAIVIPTLNAGHYLSDLIPALKSQPVPSAQFWIADSQSTDNTAAAFRDFGANVVSIERSEFNHGGTRAKIFDMLVDYDFVIAMTQDAIPANIHTIERLLEAFKDPEVALAYGRQLPRIQAKPIEQFSRIYNYPAQSAVKSLDDAKVHGVKTCFCSNSFAAYRLNAYHQVGGFELDAFFAEDQNIAGRLIIDGWKIAYCGDAEVYHSHEYTIKQEFRRYFDVGVFHSRNQWMLERFGKAEGEGFVFVAAEISYLIKHDPFQIPASIVRTLMKYTGYKLGSWQSKIPNKIKSILSMQPGYWKRLGN